MGRRNGSIAGGAVTAAPPEVICPSRPGRVEGRRVLSLEGGVQAMTTGGWSPGDDDRRAESRR